MNHLVGKYNGPRENLKGTLVWHYYPTFYFAYQADVADLRMTCPEAWITQWVRRFGICAGRRDHMLPSSRYIFPWCLVMLAIYARYLNTYVQAQVEIVIAWMNVWHDTFFFISSLDVLTWYVVLNIFSWCLDIPPQTSWCLGVWLVAAKYDPHSSIPVFKLWGPCGIILCS